MLGFPGYNQNCKLKIDRNKVYSVVIRQKDQKKFGQEAPMEDCQQGSFGMA